MFGNEIINYFIEIHFPENTTVDSCGGEIKAINWSHDFIKFMVYRSRDIYVNLDEITFQFPQNIHPYFNGFSAVEVIAGDKLER